MVMDASGAVIVLLICLAPFALALLATLMPSELGMLAARVFAILALLSQLLVVVYLATSDLVFWRSDDDPVWGASERRAIVIIWLLVPVSLSALGAWAALRTPPGIVRITLSAGITLALSVLLIWTVVGILIAPAALFLIIASSLAVGSRGENEDTRRTEELARA